MDVSCTHINFNAAFYNNFFYNPLHSRSYSPWLLIFRVNGNIKYSGNQYFETIYFALYNGRIICDIR